MAQDVNFWEAVRRIRAKDERFALELYPFVMEALDATIKQVGERRHVSAQELLDGFCRHARNRFGLLAAEVLKRWGVRSGGDVGVAVYQLVEAGVLSKRDSDRQEDFDSAGDLEEILERDYFE